MELVLSQIPKRVNHVQTSTLASRKHRRMQTILRDWFVKRLPKSRRTLQHYRHMESVRLQTKLQVILRRQRWMMSRGEMAAVWFYLMAYLTGLRAKPCHNIDGVWLGYLGIHFDS